MRKTLFDAVQYKKSKEAGGLTQEQMEKTIEKYDIVTLLRERSNSTAYEQYCQFHKKEDLDRMLEILERMYPEYTEAAKTYIFVRRQNKWK